MNMKAKMKKILIFTGLLGLLATNGCLVGEERGHEREFHEGHAEVRVEEPRAVVVRPPDVVVRPPEIIVR
jgi:hypothetical protein